MQHHRIASLISIRCILNILIYLLIYKKGFSPNNYNTGSSILPNSFQQLQQAIWFWSSMATQRVVITRPTVVRLIIRWCHLIIRMRVVATMKLTTRVATVVMATLFIIRVTATGPRTTAWCMPLMVAAPLPPGGQVAMFARGAKLPTPASIINIYVLFACCMICYTVMIDDLSWALQQLKIQAKIMSPAQYI